jgi:hypothetical protein
MIERIHDYRGGQMKTNRVAPILAVCLLFALTLACAVGATPTPTPVPPTNTPFPTDTATPVPTPTRTPLPTRTPRPTPAPIGSAVHYKSLEITVLNVINRPSVHFGDVAGNFEKFFEPLEGHFLIDVAVLVRNQNPGNPVSFKWENVFVVEANGDAWYPVWGTIKTFPSEKTLDPYTLGLNSTQLRGDDTIQFDGYTYMRLIFSVSDNPNQTILFGIEDSPFIGFRLED